MRLVTDIYKPIEKTAKAAAGAARRISKYHLFQATVIIMVAVGLVFGSWLGFLDFSPGVERAYAAFPTVQTTATSTNGETASHTVNLPSGIASGDLLIIALAVDGNPTITWPSGWTQFGANVIPAAEHTLATAYRNANGTEGATTTVTTSVNEKSAAIVWRITGNDSATAPERSTGVAIDNADADPDALTPTGGAKDYLWLAVGGNTGGAFLTAPTNYVNLLFAVSGGGTSASQVAVGGAWRQLNAASENPGAFDHDRNNFDASAATIAVYPAGAVQDPPTVTTNSATNVSTSTATLNGQANPNGGATTGWFRYATSTPGNCDDVFGTKTATSSLGAGTSTVAYSENLTGLAKGTAYYYCALASNSGGTATGAITSFVTLDTTYNQAAYRLFNNTNSTDVGSALAAQDTAVTLGSTGAEFRVRTLIHIAGAALAQSGQNFKLQFAGKGSGTCTSPSGGTPASYTDVTGATVIAYKDNAAPSDGVLLTDNANDPTHSAHAVLNQTYEEANNFTNSQSAVSVGEDALWDFSLYDNGAPTSTAYCLRIVKSDGTLLDSYDFHPEITTASAGILSGNLISSTFDTGFADGVKINAVMWQGASGTGGTNTVKFQIASANCANGATDPSACTTNIGWGGAKTSGDGAFIGSDGTSSTFYQPTGPGVPAAVGVNHHVDKRYFRYKVQIERDVNSTSPTVRDVIVNWSP